MNENDLINDYLDYSGTAPGNRWVRASGENPFEPSGPFGWRTSINLGPVSSTEMVRSLLISLSGLACTSLKNYFCLYTLFLELIFLNVYKHWTWYVLDYLDKKCTYHKHSLYPNAITKMLFYSVLLASFSPKCIIKKNNQNFEAIQHYLLIYMSLLC